MISTSTYTSRATSCVRDLRARDRAKERSLPRQSAQSPTTLLNSFNVNSATVGSYNPFRQPHYVLVNLAIGGNNGGNPSGTTFPLQYRVDFVRVYQR